MTITDADRTAINRAIAEAMGETHLANVLTCTKEQRQVHKAVREFYPNYFTDSCAADRLLAHLLSAGRTVFMELRANGTVDIEIYMQEPSLAGNLADFVVLQFEGDWKEALALAVVERGKFCLECKGELLSGTKFGGGMRGCVNCHSGWDKDEVLNWRVRKELEGK